MPGQQQWARVKGDVNCGLRRGAWYRLVSATATEGLIEVRMGPPTTTPKRVSVPRTSLEFAADPPSAWSVVARPPDARALPAAWGDQYAVCPNCRTRAPVTENDRSLRCQKCNGLFNVAWGN